jgi:hypothetical protein
MTPTETFTKNMARVLSPIAYHVIIDRDFKESHTQENLEKELLVEMPSSFYHQPIKGI